MLFNLVVLSGLLAGQALVQVEASEGHPMGVMRRRFDWVFDDPEFWHDFDEWRRERIERGRQRERERERERDRGKEHGRERERGREHGREKERDRNEPDYPPEVIIPPEEIQIIPAPSLILPTLTPTSSYQPSTTISSATYTPPPVMTTTAKQSPRKSTEVPLSIAYTTVPESTVYTTVTGRLRAMSNAAGDSKTGITTFILLVVASAMLTLLV